MPAGMDGDGENWVRGKIIDTNGRSYIITAENGATYRRYTAHAVVLTKILSQPPRQNVLHVLSVLSLGVAL